MDRLGAAGGAPPGSSQLTLCQALSRPTQGLPSGTFHSPVSTSFKIHLPSPLPRSWRDADRSLSEVDPVAGPGPGRDSDVWRQAKQPPADTCSSRKWLRTRSSQSQAAAAASHAAPNMEQLTTFTLFCFKTAWVRNPFGVQPGNSPAPCDAGGFAWWSSADSQAGLHGFIHKSGSSLQDWKAGLSGDCRPAHFPSGMLSG